jgi:hypothetical protein
MLLFKEGSHSVYFSAKHLKNSIDDDWGCGLIFLCFGRSLEVLTQRAQVQRHGTRAARARSPSAAHAN